VAGGDRLCLRLPTLVCHLIDEDSPLEHWAESSGILLDADSEVVVVVSCQCVSALLHRNIAWMRAAYCTQAGGKLDWR
jgi:Inward rectifier potassium channel C-terminal domain